ncbi:RNA pseudouridine synthase [Paramagnetospirillum marisnigri]|uniref:RNA pseudouridine synthase n=1 Tax=Paramagnetospirillum marisnigri TaxID=1285242 RepID=A0A178MF17_9PROT|nr:RNA pseudouridine synthase [Paramagnetospirillum marisnigri]OAN46658.1 RNA pseudouridine synthase [Paramagnetospirillum marisnigri]
MTPEELAARVLYRDGGVLIIDKPAGLMVHAGPKGGDHLGNYLDGLRFGLKSSPELAHRLDKETSGCLVLGRTRKALAQLGDLFAKGQVDKTYWAVVVGRPREAEGVIDLSLKKRERSHGWRMEVDRSGLPSVTQWKLLGSDGRLSWLECQPLTGRTHQIRAHCAAIGHPLVGDPIYGRGTGTLAGDRLLLHSRGISLPVYPGKPAVAATAPVPEHMQSYLLACGWDALETV